MKGKYNGLADYRISLLHQIKQGSKKEMINLLYGIANNDESFLRNLVSEDIYITHDKIRGLLRITLEACTKEDMLECVELAYYMRKVAEYIDSMDINCEILKHACAYDSIRIVEFMLTSEHVQIKPTIGGMNVASSITNTNKITPLGIACLYESKQTINYLLKGNNIAEKILENDYVSIRMAIKGNKVNTLSKLICNIKNHSIYNEKFCTNLFLESIKAINSSAKEVRHYLINDTLVKLTPEVREILSTMNYQEELKQLEIKEIYKELNLGLKTKEEGRKGSGTTKI